jgi:hypothetical protein
MAEKEEEKPSAPTAEKKGLVQKINDSPLWVKIGAIAGVAGVGLMWYLGNRNQAAAANTPVQAGVMTGGSGTPTDYIGEGDIYPPATMLPSSGGTSSTSSNTTGSGVPATGLSVSAKNAGAFASTAGGTNNGGINYGSIQPGQQLSLVAATPSQFKNVNYYQVSNQSGQTGYVRGSTIGLP